ncbi:MAG TPA: LysM peptidoglycan-binding domain-containing protein [Ktedonobacterales bacterium]
MKGGSGMGMRGSDSATLARERERLASAWTPAQPEDQAEWPLWLDELLDGPGEAHDEREAYVAHSRAPELSAPDRPEWLDFSAYHQAVSRRASTGQGERASTGRPYDARAQAEHMARPPRASRAARFARIAREIRGSWGPETTAYATDYHPAAAPAPTSAPVRPRQTAVPRPTPRPKATLAPKPTPRPPARQSVRLRVAQVSRRLADLASRHVVVRIPGRAPRVVPKAEMADGATAAAVGNHMRVMKLPRVWLLANLMILLVAGWAIVPRLAIVTPESACAWHVVAPGDTLGKLGAANHTSALAIAHANSLADPDQIYVGERLCIPLAFFASSGAAPYVPPAPPQPPHYGPVSGVHNFIAFVLPYARRAHDATGWPTSMIIAQWGLEQGWHLPSYTGYNFGNCGAVPGEPTIGGLNVPGSPSAFTYSKTPEDGLRVYIHVAHLSYYTGVAWAAQHQGVDAAARALGQSPWDAGHYTDHNDPGSSLIAILHAYNLYQYD